MRAVPIFLTHVASVGTVGALFGVRMSAALFVVNMTILGISALSAYYSYRLYTTVPSRFKDAVRNLFLAVTALAVAVSTVLSGPLFSHYGYLFLETAEFLSLMAIVASVSFFLLLSFDVKAGKL